MDINLATFRKGLIHNPDSFLCVSNKILFIHILDRAGLEFYVVLSANGLEIVGRHSVLFIVPFTLDGKDSRDMVLLEFLKVSHGLHVVTHIN